MGEPADTEPAGTATRPGGQRRVLAALALAQFICSFAGSNMNVMINDISEDLDTTVQGVQVAITVFLLVMAALMIPGGRLTDLPHCPKGVGGPPSAANAASWPASSSTRSAPCSARPPRGSGC
ncbi:hypothetical protein [Streptomyces antibioticus]|uniref:hypothetical protein n=1 Tax=Streptomyces antibioticus TaxID=1890 RepID=UPI0036AE7A85